MDKYGKIDGQNQIRALATICEPSRVTYMQSSRSRSSHDATAIEPAADMTESRRSRGGRTVLTSENRRAVAEARRRWMPGSVV